MLDMSFIMKKLLILKGARIRLGAIVDAIVRLTEVRPDWSQAFPTFTLFAVSVIEWRSVALRNSSLNECTLALLLLPCVLSHLLDLIICSMQMNPPNDSLPPLYFVPNLSFAVPREAAFSLAQKMN